MLEQKDTIEIEKFSSYLNLLLAGFLILYFLMFNLYGKKDFQPNEIVFAITITILGTDFIIGKFDFFMSDFIIGIIKFSELICFAMLGFSSGVFIGNVFVSGIIYFLITLQAFVLFDITETFSRIEAVIFTLVPILIGIMVHLIFNKLSNFEIFTYICFLFIFITCEIASIKCLAYVYNKLFEKISILNRAASLNKEENDIMKSTQDKLVSVNQQLSLQRFKLEKANEQITKNNEKSQLLNRFNTDLSLLKNVDDLIDKICQNVMKYMRTDFCYIGIIRSDEINKEWFYKSYDYKDSSKITEANYSFFNGSTFLKKYTSEPLMIIHDDFANLKMDCLNGSDVRSSILYSSDAVENYKVLYIIGSVTEKTLSEDTVFVNNLFSQLTLAINNAILYSKMHNMAIKDALTGIYNRQYFNSIYNDILNKAVDKAAYEKKDLTVVLFDIDKFKSVNDTYGHIVGDVVIRYCGRISDKYTEENGGLAVRYGGEEFVLVFPEKGVDEVFNICEKMHKEIREEVICYEDKKFNINVSMGIATYPDICKEPKELVDYADKAMYYSKKNGRGRITIYDTDKNM